MAIGLLYGIGMHQQQSANVHKGEGAWLDADKSDKGGGGSIFVTFLRRTFMDDP